MAIELSFEPYMEDISDLQNQQQIGFMCGTSIQSYADTARGTVTISSMYVANIR